MGAELGNCDASASHSIYVLNVCQAYYQSEMLKKTKK